MDDGWRSVRPFLTDQKINYAVGIGDDAVTKQYNISSLPVTLLIDRQGRIAESHVGVVDRASFENDIRALLREDPAQLPTNKQP